MCRECTRGRWPRRERKDGVPICWSIRPSPPDRATAEPPRRFFSDILCTLASSLLLVLQPHWSLSYTCTQRRPGSKNKIKLISHINRSIYKSIHNSNNNKLNNLLSLKINIINKLLSTLSSCCNTELKWQQKQKLFSDFWRKREKKCFKLYRQKNYFLLVQRKLWVLCCRWGRQSRPQIVNDDAFLHSD